MFIAPMVLFVTGFFFVCVACVAWSYQGDKLFDR